jgi:hypothetical protein
MYTRLVAVVTVFWGVQAVVLGQPKEFSDDFMTVATYNSDSWYATCIDPNAPSTKYTVMEGYTGTVYNERMVSGGGKLRFSNRSVTEVIPGAGRFEFSVIGVVDLGQPCPDNPDPTPGNQSVTSEPFTSQNLCMYGGFSYKPVELRGAGDTGVLFGPDGQPGIANVDDDRDGTTDEHNESPCWAPIAGSGYGPPFPGGRDSRPGVAGVDDDGDGTTDDVGETGWTGSDDGDDQRYLPAKGPMMRGNIATTSTIVGWISPSSKYSLFCIYEIYNSAWIRIQGNNEITPGFYQPRTHYNYLYCVSGTCYGAMLWTGTDMSNPNETVGPLTNSHHTATSDNMCGLYNTTAYDSGEEAKVYLRNHAHLGNSNFGDTFWVVSGNPATYYASPSADLDRDKDVDGFDFLTFSNCYNGSNKPPLAACANTQADLDKDGDVDGFDFLTFSNCYNGSNRKPLAACFPPNVTNCAS